MRLITLLLWLYPADWRARYAEEFREVLAARPLLPRDLLDVALNALDAHLNPTLIGTALNERMMELMQKLRSAEITIFAAWVAFVVAGLHFYVLMDDSPYNITRNGQLLGPQTNLDLSNPLGLTWNILAGGSAIALLGVLVGGVPLAYAAWQRSPQVRRQFLVPVVAFVAILLPLAIGIVIIVLTRPHAQQTPNPVLTGGFGLAYSLYFIAAAVMRAVARAIAAADLGERQVRFALWPGVVTTLAMALMLGATVAWGITAHLQKGQYFDSLNYFAGYPTFISWGLIVLTMLIATVVAAVATMRGFGARGESSSPAVAVA